MIRFLVGIFFLFGSSLGYAQGVEFTYNHDEFSIDVKEQLSATANPISITVGESFTVAWSTFGPDVRNKIIGQTKALIASGHRLQPNLETYFAAIAYAVNDEKLTDLELVSYLNMTQQVIDNYSLSEELKYFERMTSFFEHRSLYHNNYLDLGFKNEQYRFVYVASEDLNDTSFNDEFAEEDTSYSEENWEEENWEEEEWTEEEWSEEEWSEEEWEDEDVTLESLLEEEIVVRPLSGPTILFDDGEFDLNVQYDSIKISRIKGSLLVMEDVFVGTSGRIDWSTVGLDPKEVYVDLTNYELPVNSSQFVLRGAKLTYGTLFEKPINGEFEFKPEKTSDIKNKSYPRFSSVENNISITGLFGPYSYYTGGFTIQGTRINSNAKYSGLATLEMDGESGPKFTVKSYNINFADSVAISDRARLVIHTKFDSIYHPAVRVRFDSKTNNLIVQKDNGSFRNTPFVASANQMSFTADLISWNLNQDSLYISTLLARKEVPLIFQSNEYYDLDLFRNIRGLYNFNPLKVVLSYCEQEGVDQFYVEEIATKRNLSLKNLQGAIMSLYQQGYVDYDKESGVVSLTAKGLHKGEAQNGKADYDNLLLLSLMDTGSNAIYDLKTQEVHIKGVDRFYLAKVLDVSVEADSNQITILKNRDIKFNGKLAAGNFDYVGRDFIFRYDSFLVEMQQIDAIELYVLEETKDGFNRKKINNSLSGIPEGGLQPPKEEAEEGAVPDSTAFDQTLPNEDSPQKPGGETAMAAISGTSGVLYISKPKNKSGKKLIPNFPKFQGGGTGSVVYFDKPEILSGVYDRSLYFTLPPFDLDSLSDSDPASISFSGVFHSDDWFPDFSEELGIMEDYSLGFDHSIPPEGYQLFGGNGRLYNHLSLNKNGIVGDGNLDFLTTTMQSQAFVFYPDSVAADGELFTMRKEDFGGVVYPQIMAESFHMKWLPQKDSMYITNQGPLFAMYEGLANLDGSVIVTNKGVNGLGVLNTYNSTTKSDSYTFNSDDYNARHAEFEIKSDNPEKPALAGDDVRLSFDLETKQAEMSPEIAGVAAISFPYAQFKTSITKARWDLENQKVFMTKPEEVDINSSYFYTTREDLDSLRFNASAAEYDMQSLELKVSGIPYINVADAKITPENGEVLILENARIGTLYNTTIDLDTLTGYHEIYDATVTIISRNEFEGEGTYRLINAMKDTFGIKLRDFHLENFTEGRRGNEVSQHSVATGSISEEDNLMISPGMFYKGNVKLLAHKPALELDGYVKLDLKSIKDYNTWIKYASEAEQQEIQFLFDESVTSSGQLLSAGLHFDFNDFSLYSTFCYDKNDPQDEDFFKPSGYLSFKADSNEYIIINRDKDLGLTYSGKVFAYDETTRGIRFEGPVHFIDNTKTMGIVAAAMGDGNMATNELSFKSMMTMDFKVPSTIYGLMADDFTQVIEEFGAPEADIDRTELLYLLSEIIGNRATKAYEERSAMDYVPLVSTSPNLVRPFVFSNINFKWSADQTAFYNDGEVGLSNILRTDINSQMESFFEIRKTEEGETINLFIKAAPESWYYFSYENNRLFIYSSNKEVNDFVLDKTNIGKAKLGEFEFGPSDRAETLQFINTFRAIYFDIDEPYDLQGGVIIEEKKAEEEAEEDDGFR